MLLFLLSYLEKNFNVQIPAVFHYYSTRMMLAAITSLIISIFFGPYFIRKLYELKIGQPIRSEEEHCLLLGQLHKNKKHTPTMGGILILVSMLVSLVLYMDLKSVYTLILFLATLAFGSLGALDDYKKIRHANTKGLSAKRKLLFQSLFSSALAFYMLCPTVSEWIHFSDWFAPPVFKEFRTNADNQVTSLLKKESNGSKLNNIKMQHYASRYYIPFFKEPIIVGVSLGALLLAFLFTNFVIVGSSNAVNLTDGLDGLAAGCLLMVASSLALIAFVSNHADLARYLNIVYVEGSGEIAIYLSAFVGSCLGFLWYNGHPAQVFMGDTGSLALGAIIGVSSVLLKREMLLAIVGGIFVAEALSVILQVTSFKLRNKKRIFLCTPLHHHFEYQGWPETKVVVRFWIVGLLLAIVGIASLKFQ